MSGITVPADLTKLDVAVSSRTSGSLANLDAAISSRAPAILADEGALISPATAASTGALGSYVQVVAATAHTVRGFQMSLQNTSGARSYRVVLATGGPGSEVVKKVVRVVLTLGTVMTGHIPLDPTLIPKGVRVSVAAANDSSAVSDTISVGIMLDEAND